MDDPLNNVDSSPTARSMGVVRSIVRALRTDTRTVEFQLGISLAQLFVLQQLADRPVFSLNELAERTSTHQSSVSVVVRRLVERGYVARVASTTDRRRIEIAVTPTGRALLDSAPPTVSNRLSTAVLQMPVPAQQALADLLERWVRAAQIDLLAPPALGDREAEIPTDDDRVEPLTQRADARAGGHSRISPESTRA